MPGPSTVTYFPRFTMATGLGPEGCVIISMLAKIEPRTYVFNLDTGYQFAETLALREQIMDKYGCPNRFASVEQNVAEYEATNDGPVYKSDPDTAAAAIGRSTCSNAWRHDSTHGPPGFAATRARRGPTRPIVQWDKKFGLVKISPLAPVDHQGRLDSDCRRGDPLQSAAQPGGCKIGCWPCTRPVVAGEDELAAGRWSGTAKTECGLHTSAE